MTLSSQKRRRKWEWYEQFLRNSYQMVLFFSNGRKVTNFQLQNKSQGMKNTIENVVNKTIIVLYGDRWESHLTW